MQSAVAYMYIDTWNKNDDHEEDDDNNNNGNEASSVNSILYHHNTTLSPGWAASAQHRSFTCACVGVDPVLSLAKHHRHQYPYFDEDDDDYGGGRVKRLGYVLLPTPTQVGLK